MENRVFQLHIERISTVRCSQPLKPQRKTELSVSERKASASLPANRPGAFHEAEESSCQAETTEGTGDELLSFCFKYLFRTRQSRTLTMEERLTRSFPDKLQEGGGLDVCCMEMIRIIREYQAFYHTSFIPPQRFRPGNPVRPTCRSDGRDSAFRRAFCGRAPGQSCRSDGR